MQRMPLLEKFNYLLLGLVDFIFLLYWVFVGKIVSLQLQNWVER